MLEYFDHFFSEKRTMQFIFGRNFGTEIYTYDNFKFKVKVCKN